MITEITKAQLLTWRLGTRNEGRATPLKSLWLKNNVDMAINIAREADKFLVEWESQVNTQSCAYDESRISYYL
jgi:hypothetical protein